MATLTAGVAGINFDTLTVGDLLLGDVITATATQFSLRDGAWQYDFTGSFTYANNAITGGTIASWTETQSGQMVFQLTGTSVPVTNLTPWAATNNSESAKSAFLAGDDRIVGSQAGDRMFGYGGNDTITDAGGTNYLRGDAGNDSISGGTGFDDINGNMGNDTAHGNDGDDWVVGGQNNDLLTGDNGFDIVYGNLGDATSSGDAGVDWVRGGQGNDSGSGGAGDDWIWGDRGDDTISGGSGADIFHSFSGAGLDRVTDFSLADGDRVQLDPGTTYTVKQVGSDTVIDLGGGDQVVLVGVQATTLAATSIFVG
jgi:Ca2+-binding RTX toxin-like protein